MSVILTRDYDTLECDLYTQSAILQYPWFETVRNMPERPENIQ
jgi:hypothetical protein